MKLNADILSIFPKLNFWDVDYSKLDLKKDKDFIIPRALYFTTKDSFEDDIEKLEKYYTKKVIVSQLKSTKERISNEVCIQVAYRYNIDPFYRYK